MRLLSASTLGLLALPGAQAWGSLGHITVAYVAQDFVAAPTEAYLKTLLRNDTDSYLAGVATWADSIRYTKWGHFTGVFHFIDAKDSPPASCGIDMARDCKAEGCIVTAFANYTARTLAVSSLPAWQRAQAAKFVVHFAGDVHQPLHDEDVERGGNGIHVLWEDKELNLHHVWDSSIAEKLVGGLRRRKPYEVARSWAANLTAEIRAGRFAAESRRWLDGVDDVADAEATVLRWAREGNAYVCSHVFSPHGPKDIVGQELSGEYYEKAAPVIEVQVARAGFRLARWLDLMVASLHESGDVGEL